MNNLLIDNEFSQLDTVILGSGHEFGGCPDISDAYDPKSKESIRSNIYPLELNITKELDATRKEPAKENVLFNNPKVLLTPHIAASTSEASTVVAEMVANQISDFLNLVF